MATSKGRGGANTKAATKQSAPARKSTGQSGSAPANRGGSKGVAPQKSVAAPKKAAAKSTAGGKSGAGTATKSPGASRNGNLDKSVADRNAGAGKGAGSATRGGAVKASAAPSRNGNASPARKSAGAKGGAAKTDPRNDLAKILQDLMQDIYYAEKKLTKALGKMAKNATDTKLREAFTTHQSQTEEQVSRLEEAFEMLGQKAKAKRCAAMDGLLEEANEHIEEYKKGAGLDAALIVGAQKVEHYEIAAYGSMRSIARTLGQDDVAAIFDEIREQESDTDELLTTIAESVVNLKAEGETEDVKDGSGNNSSSRNGQSANNGGDDSDAGEDSSAVSSRESSDDNDSNDNDGAGRGISALTDGADRGEASNTGEAMGY